MNSIKRSVPFLFLFLACLGFTACQDPCSDRDCLNDGICIDGICDCPENVFGEDCEFFNALALDELIKIYSPFELYDGGVSIKQLIGRSYLNGYIFYLDVEKREGMVTRVVLGSHQFGCLNQNIEELPFVTSDPQDIEAEPGARIGDGMSNTNAILANNCLPSNHGAAVCRQLGPEWFLPSRGEMNLIFKNLADYDGNGRVGSRADDPGNIVDLPYLDLLTSSTYDNEKMWIRNFFFSYQIPFSRSSDISVLAVRSF